MGGCFSLQNEHDNPVDDQHQQPGEVPVTLRQSIYDFFKECIPSIGGSGEEDTLLPPSAEDEVLEIAHNP